MVVLLKIDANVKDAREAFGLWWFYRLKRTYVFLYVEGA